jgi:hypothetical protein
MTKKKFILFLGVGWSGTTSLYYTLQNNLQYMHGGLMKELHYLAKVFDQEKRSLGFSFEELLYRWNYSAFRSRIKYDFFDTPLSQFTKKEFNSIIIDTPSLKNYSNYYQNLAKYCEGNYQAVGDFSNSNYRLTEAQLYKVLSVLNEFFDVKVIFIFRDFIRRCWSHISSFSLDNEKSTMVKYAVQNNISVPLFSGDVKDNIKNGK